MKPRPWLPDPGWTGDWTLPPVLERPLDEAERAALVALSLGGRGPGRLVEDLRGADRVTDVLAGLPNAPDPASALGRVHRAGARVVVPADPEYPECLAEIAAPPPLLFVRGRRLDEMAPFVAIVGARSCTSGAKRFARRLGSAFASAGFTVVSGLARGIDGSAHLGALETGTTVAVLGTGPNRCYPVEHQAMADEIAEVGAIITEFPPGVGPRAWHFPARNRIVSGIALGVIVVEAGERSGALITAGFAADQGREVMACTVGPENPAGAGVRAMLREGATLVVEPEDAVTHLAMLARAHGYDVDPGAPSPGAGSRPRLSGEAARVYDAVSEGTPLEQVARETGLPIGRVTAVLSALELDGLLVAQGGGRWDRVGA